MHVFLPMEYPFGNSLVSHWGVTSLSTATYTEWKHESRAYVYSKLWYTWTQHQKCHFIHGKRGNRMQKLIPLRGWVRWSRLATEQGNSRDFARTSAHTITTAQKKESEFELMMIEPDPRSLMIETWEECTAGWQFILPGCCLYPVALEGWGTPPPIEPCLYAPNPMGVREWEVALSPALVHTLSPQWILAIGQGLDLQWWLYMWFTSSQLSYFDWNMEY